MTAMTIAALAREGGVGIETVRFYQRKGLMPRPQRATGMGPQGGVRRYGTDDVRRLRFIKAAQSAGFTLQEIGELLRLDATDDRARARELARTRIATLDTKIAELKMARDALAKLARRCAHGKAGACPILTAFESNQLPRS
jgi:MerR family mercuric resistance operon transcriptional regulator